MVEQLTDSSCFYFFHSFYFFLFGHKRRQAVQLVGDACRHGLGLIVVSYCALTAWLAKTVPSY
jgi:hypothetical protein